VKIATLLTQYLYTNNRLDLPGIGTFFLDPAILTQAENGKTKTAPLDGITFQANPLTKESPELIAFISAQSGKMKALAISDLESHLELAQQFLNIGKPFTFEGIGTIVKEKGKEYYFTPGSIAFDRFKDQVRDANAVPREDNKKYESFLTEPKPPTGMRKPAVALLILAGLGLAIWGGYSISRKAKKEIQTNVAETITPQVTIADTTTTPMQDTVPVTLPAKSVDNNYKYILEVAKSQRAFKRFNQLRTNQWEVKLETTDSVQYKLVLLLPTLNADTTRVLDSLTAMTGRRVYIEHQN
jgi:hypothetical protein